MSRKGGSKHPLFPETGGLKFFKFWTLTAKPGIVQILPSNPLASKLHPIDNLSPKQVKTYEINLNQPTFLTISLFRLSSTDIIRIIFFPNMQHLARSSHMCLFLTRVVCVCAKFYQCKTCSLFAAAVYMHVFVCIRVCLLAPRYYAGFYLIITWNIS